MVMIRPAKITLAVCLLAAFAPTEALSTNYCSTYKVSAA